MPPGLPTAPPRQPPPVQTRPRSRLRRPLRGRWSLLAGRHLLRRPPGPRRRALWRPAPGAARRSAAATASAALAGADLDAVEDPIGPAPIEHLPSAGLDEDAQPDALALALSAGDLDLQAVPAFDGPEF